MTAEQEMLSNGNVPDPKPSSTMMDETTTHLTMTTEKEEKEAEQKKKEKETGSLKDCMMSASSMFRHYRKYTVVLGGILVYVPIGVPWYFGNLAAYLASYFRQKEAREDDVVDPQWIFSAFFVAFSLAIVLSGYMANALGTRTTVFIAMIIHSGATFLSYFATKHSMEALIITFGAVGGLGAGLAYGPPMPTVSKWLPRHVGVASGVLLTGFGGGAVIYNELITLYINPTNIQPDIKTHRSSYFSQPEVLTKIPEVFLVLGALTLGIQILGLILIRDPEPGDHIEEVESTELKPIVANEKKAADETTDVDLHGDTLSQNSVKETEVESKELSPLDVLKQKDFYLLWLALGLNHYGYVIKNNYYKEFGAAKVDNDHLLTTIGTVSTIAVAISRLCWGLICDMVGIKMTVMLLLGSTSVLASFWYFTLMAGPGLYFVWTVAITWVMAGAFIIFPLAALALFGQHHYATNYGLISTVQVVVNLLSPPLIRYLLHSHGWFSIFISIAISNLIGVVGALFLCEM